MVIFIAIGHAPNIGTFKSFVEIDQQGCIITKPGITRKSSVFTAADFQDNSISNLKKCIDKYQNENISNTR